MIGKMMELEFVIEKELLKFDIIILVQLVIQVILQFIHEQLLLIHLLQQWLIVDF
jgi:hypothetical protein